MVLQRLAPKGKTNSLGKLAEDFAAKMICGLGYKILTRNFRSRFGEIDIVALKDECLIFVEVKARWNLKFGTPQEAVTKQKLWKIKKTAEYFSLKNPGFPKKLGIEVVAIEIEDEKVVSAKIIKVD